MAKIAVGIDLGTTYSCIAAYVNGKVEVLSDFDGNRTMPSVVAFTETGEEVGQLAKENVFVEAGCRVYGKISNPLIFFQYLKFISLPDAKRMIGRKFDDPAMQNEKSRWPFKLMNDNNAIKISVLDRLYAPEDISAMVLKKLKENAENKLEKKIRDAVITVPAYFNDSQRQATMKAAAKAELNVLRLISEPSAAALSYGLDKYYQNKRTVLIYDLGGGTFDVSILKIGEGHFRTLSTSGDTHLGGQDFDNRLFDYLVKKFQQDFNVNLMDYQDEADKKRKQKSQRKLHEKCQQAKHKLSDTDQVRISIETFFRDIDYQQVVTRKEFEDLNQDLFQITKKCIKEALDGARLSHDDINDIVLVGGSTKILKIQEMIRDSFKKSEIIKTINVDEAVAVGACLEASKIAKINASSYRVTEVTPFSLGIKTRDEEDIFTKVVDRYSTIPVSKSKIIQTLYDNQTSVHFPVYEGENPHCKDNNYLGEFKIRDVLPLPAGQAKFNVTFSIDSNGILKVTAVDMQNGNEASIDINYGKGRLAGIETRN
jgi:molecular chaperone DnaK (HSP70)